MAKENPEKGDDKKGRGLIGMLAAVVLLTVVGLGVGFISGGQLKLLLSAPVKPESVMQEAKVDVSASTQLMQMPSIVTNLAGDRNWLRLDFAVVLGDAKVVAPGYANGLADDVTALIRTLSIQQIAGPTGFQHLREEIFDRLVLRSSGRVKELTIQSMVIE